MSRWLARDRGRFADARKRLNECPLGAAALAGTSFPIDRDMTAQALGFDRPDRQLARCRIRPRLRAGDARGRSDRGGASVAAGRRDRDLDVAAVRASSKLSDKFTTGSSIMPQKRNPDAAELVRAKAGPHHRRAHRTADGDEGPAARLSEGHAGGQGARHVMRSAALALCVAAMAGMVTRHRAGHCAHAEMRPARAMPPPPISPTGWCGR